MFPRTDTTTSKAASTAVSKLCCLIQTQVICICSAKFCTNCWTEDKEGDTVYYAGGHFVQSADLGIYGAALCQVSGRYVCDRIVAGKNTLVEWTKSNKP